MPDRTIPVRVEAKVKCKGPPFLKVIKSTRAIWDNIDSYGFGSSVGIIVTTKRKPTAITVYLDDLKAAYPTAETLSILTIVKRKRRKSK